MLADLNIGVVNGKRYIIVINIIMFTLVKTLKQVNLKWAQVSTKVMKNAKIRNRYNQVPHHTRDTIWESDKNTRKHHTQESQEFSPFLAGDHKAARNRQDSIMQTNWKHKEQKGSTKRCTALEWSLKLEGLNMFNGANFKLNSNVDQDTYMFGSHERSINY